MDGAYAKAASANGALALCRTPTSVMCRNRRLRKKRKQRAGPTSNGSMIASRRSSAITTASSGINTPRWAVNSAVQNEASYASHKLLNPARLLMEAEMGDLSQKLKKGTLLIIETG